ncbi:MAG: RDD family protein [Armatimonadetes bacterium]|nr:RDD family protein [Akkermansiaceae bacterium]
MEEQIETMDVEEVQSSEPVVIIPALGAEASLGQRIGAVVIDALVAMALGWALAMINSRLSYPVYIAYFLTRDSLPFLNGQSIGKKALNLQAVSETGKSLSGDWNSGLLRNVPMVIPIFPLVELIILVINKDKPGGLRRLGDQWAKTKVVTVTS